MCEVSVDLGFMVQGVDVGLVIEAVADAGEESAVTKDLEIWSQHHGLDLYGILLLVLDISSHVV